MIRSLLTTHITVVIVAYLLSTCVLLTVVISICFSKRSSTHGNTTVECDVALKCKVFSEKSSEKAIVRICSSANLARESSLQPLYWLIYNAVIEKANLLEAL